MKGNKLINILMIIVFIVGLGICIWCGHEVRNYIIPEAGVSIKEATRNARQIIKTEIWVGMIMVGVSYIYSFIYTKN